MIPVLIRKWTDSICSLPLPPLPVLFRPFHIQVKIVPQLVPNTLLLAPEDVRQDDLYSLQSTSWSLVGLNSARRAAKCWKQTCTTQHFLQAKKNWCSRKTMHSSSCLASLNLHPHQSPGWHKLWPPKSYVLWKRCIFCAPPPHTHTHTFFFLAFYVVYFNWFCSVICGICFKLWYVQYAMCVSDLQSWTS